jgi:hypothetical protein
MSDYTIRRTCDAAPVQYEGEVGDRAWYFRARYDEWSFGVGTTTAGAVGAAMDGTGDFHRSGVYDPDGDGWGASWMEHGEAERLISQCIEEYTQHKAVDLSPHTEQIH